MAAPHMAVPHTHTRCGPTLHGGPSLQGYGGPAQGRPCSYGGLMADAFIFLFYFPCGFACCMHI